LAAADEALDGNVAAAKKHLQSAFDRLHEAREYFYPLDARMLDLTLVASSTIGQSLRDELAGGVPRNFLVSGEVIEEMAQREPDTLAALKQALDADTACLVGGEFTETSLPLLDPEAIAQRLSRGLTTYQQHLQHRPDIFGRRRFGLTPLLPQVLRRLGFAAALHCTLDDGRFPTSSQSQIQWEGLDGTPIEALGCLPIDASRVEQFLSLPKKLSDTMSLDRTATVIFAHWPGRSCCWYEDLRRIAAYGSVLGSFATMTSYFDDTSSVGEQKPYMPDQYRSPCLKQDVAAGQRDPISRWARYFTRRAQADAADAFNALATLCSGRKPEAQELSDSAALAPASSKAARDALIQDSLTPDDAIDKELKVQLDKSLANFARSLIGVTASTRRGALLVNPLCCPQQACLALSDLPSPLAAVPTPPEIPPLGFTWIDRDAPVTPPPVELKGWFRRRKPTTPPPLAEANLLRNEFCEIHFDPATGAIRAISDYESRDPRLAQQIALRLPQGGEPGADENYSIMAADEIKVTSAGPVLGEIVCRGWLLDRDGRRVAGYEQTTRVWRGSRVIDLSITLDIERQPGANPWDSYYAARFAWKDETSALHRSVGLTDLPTDLTQFESPHFVDITLGKQRTTLLCGGLPYHRRLGLRKLDTLLAVQGETARSFHLGIAIDVPNPTAAALGFLAPPLALPDQPSPPAPTGWLFHLDRRNVQATHWEASLVAQASRLPPEQPGRPHHNTAFRVRLLETEGRGVTAGLRCFRPVVAARKINVDDVPAVPLAVEGDKVEITIGPHQWIEVEVILS
jgi:alpha-mannosidase